MLWQIKGRTIWQIKWLPDKHLNGTLHFIDKPYLLEQISTQASKVCVCE